MNGAEALIESLKQEKVEVVFGYPGGAVLSLYDALYKMKLPHVLTRHEQGAVHAADGYARATGKVGVCFATSGPGGTNLVTGIATANMDSVPLVCITGQVATPLIGKDSFQEADICGITTPITKHNYLVKNVEDLPRIIKEAFYIARTGRPGPVLIDVAKDVFDAQLSGACPTKVTLRGYSGSFGGSESEIDAAVQALRQAKRPVIFAGGGVTISDTAAALREIVDECGIPVALSLMGLGTVSAASPYNLGMVGMHGSYAANMAVMQADLLIGIGVRFDDRVTGRLEQFAPQAKIVHFDVDAAEINKNVKADLRVLGDLRWSLPTFAARVKLHAAEIKLSAAEWAAKTKQDKQDRPFSYQADNEQLKAQQVIARVSELTDGEAVVVTDVGQHQMWAAQFYDVKNERSFITSGGLGTMGYGLPAAIGAKLGRRDKPVVLFSGDGSIMMNCQEFATAADYNVNVKVIVLNNHVLGMVAQWQRMFYGERYSESLLHGGTDYVKLAEAMGVKGWRVAKPSELDAVLTEALAYDGPAFIEVLLPEKEDVLPMVPAGGRLDEMVLGDK